MKKNIKSFSVVFCRREIRRAIPFFALLFAATCLQAQTSYYWRTSPGSGSWNTATNWADTPGGTTGGLVPSGADSAVFDLSSQTAITFTAGSHNVASMVFNASSPAYTITLGNNRELSFNGAGIVNNSATTRPTINVNLGSILYFNGTASAGNAILSYASSGGEIWFQGNSTAGNAHIAVGKQHIFLDNATAGNATFDIVSNSSLDFSGNTSAENATINLSGFQSIVYFSGSTSGGTAKVNAGNNASVVFSKLDTSGLTLGSISGVGNFYFGAKNLTVGSNNLSTEVSGGLLDDSFGYPFDTGGSLIKVGTGTLTLSGANTYSGTTTVADGALVVANSNALAGSTLNYNNAGGAVSFSNLTTINLGGLTGDRDFVLTNPLGSAITLSVGANGKNSSYDGALSGLGTLVKTGTGTFTLSGNNTQAGGVQVTNGVFMLAGAATFGGGTLDVTGGAFDLNGTTYSLGNLIVNGGTVRNGTLPISTFIARSGTISAGITGGEFVKSGTGSLHLTGANTYTGATTITGGGLRVAAGSLPAGSYYRFNGGALGVGDGNPTAYVAGTGEGEISWEGDGGFAAYGAARTITFNGAGTQTWGQGGFVPNGSALILGANGSDNLTIFANAIDFDGGTRTVRVENGSAALDATLSGALTNGSLVKTGDGTLNLTGANSYAGGTRIAGGLIQFAALSDMGSGAILLDGGGLKWSSGSSVDVSGSVAYGNGGSIFDTNGNNVTFATAVGTGTAGGTTSGGLTKLGPGTLTLQGSNQYTGTTTVSQGTLVVTGNNSATGDLFAAAGATIIASGQAGALGSGTVTINTGTSLQLAYDANTTFGTGIRFSGDSPAILFNRATNGAGVTYTFKDAFFEGTAGGQAVTFARGSLASTGTTTVAFDNVSTGLDATLTLAPSMRVNMSSLAIGANHGFTVADTGTGTNPTLTIGTLSGTNSGFYNLSNSRANVQFTGPITGQDVIIQLYSTGTKTFSSASTFTGTSDLWQGTVVAGNNAAFGQSKLVLDSLTFSGIGALTIGNTLELWTGVTFSGTSNLTFTGTLTNTQGGNNTISVSNTGTTTFGSVNLADSNTNRTVTIAPSAGANVVINGTIANGSTSTASNLTKTGVGNLTLTGSNTYSGTTTLTGGNLIIGHNNALGGSTLSFNGGTLSGNGTSRTLANAMTFGVNSAISGTSNLSLTGNFNLGTTTRTLTVTNTGSTIFSGTLSNTAGLIKAGAGELILSGTSSTFTGKTTINAGALTVMALSNTSVISSLGAPTTAANATIDIGATTGSGTLRYIGAGSTSNRVINLAGTSGGATIDSSGSGALVLNAAAFTASGAGSKSLTLTGSNTGANTVSSTIVNNSVANITSLNKTGSGFWNVTGANTYTGSTTIREGILSANKIAVTGSNSSLGNAASAVVLGDTTTSGTLGYTGNSVTYTRGFTVNAGGGGFATATSGQTTTIGTGGIATAGRFTVSGAGDTGITSAISGTGSVGKAGAGTLTLSSSNAYTGGTVVDSGTLQISNINAVGSGTVSVNGGVFSVDAGGALANTVQLAGGIFARMIGSGTSYANSVNAISELAGGVDTTANVLAGTASGTTALLTSFSSTTTSSSALNDEIRLSDVYSFQGTGSDIFVLQLSFSSTDPGAYLGWLSGNQWINARDGNVGNNPAFAAMFAGSYAEFLIANPGVSLADSLGAWGATASGGTTYVWAVLNHNSEFSVVPEPGVASLMVGSLAFLLIRRRRV